MLAGTVNAQMDTQMDGSPGWVLLFTVDTNLNRCINYIIFINLFQLLECGVSDIVRNGLNLITLTYYPIAVVILASKYYYCIFIDLTCNYNKTPIHYINYWLIIYHSVSYRWFYAIINKIFKYRT